jgi:hypothetical protein
MTIRKIKARIAPIVLGDGCISIKWSPGIVMRADKYAILELKSTLKNEYNKNNVTGIDINGNIIVEYSGMLEPVITKPE